MSQSFLISIDLEPNTPYLVSVNKNGKPQFHKDYISNHATYSVDSVTSRIGLISGHYLIKSLVKCALGTTMKICFKDEEKIANSYFITDSQFLELHNIFLQIPEDCLLFGKYLENSKHVFIEIVKGETEIENWLTSAEEKAALIVPTIKNEAKPVEKNNDMTSELELALKKAAKKANREEETNDNDNESVMSDDPLPPLPEEDDEEEEATMPLPPVDFDEDNGNCVLIYYDPASLKKTASASQDTGPNLEEKQLVIETHPVATNPCQLFSSISDLKRAEEVQDLVMQTEDTIEFYKHYVPDYTKTVLELPSGVGLNIPSQDIPGPAAADLRVLGEQRLEYQTTTHL